MDNLHQPTVNLLMAIWRGIASDYKSRYRRSIWQQFEDAVRASAYTNSLSKFINTICAKLSVQFRAEDGALVERILKEGNDRTILKLLREETTYLVLLVRVANQERVEKWKAARAEWEAEELERQHPDWGLPVMDDEDYDGGE